MSTEAPIPNSWDFDIIWACEAKICWNGILEINPSGKSFAPRPSGSIMKMTIKPTDRGKKYIEKI